MADREERGTRIERQEALTLPPPVADPQPTPPPSDTQPAPAESAPVE